MKKFLVALIVVLLVWNSYLAFEISQLKSVDTVPTKPTQVYNNNTINGFTSDLTNVISKTESKVVSITSSAHENLVSIGSGVVYSKDDTGVYIVTNQHVIANSTEIFVTFDNGEVLLANLLGSDELTDLAVLKVTPTFDVEPFNLGEATVLKKGEYVIAMGSPLGQDFQGSVTFGILSGLDRTVPVDLNEDGIIDWEMIVLQTDAAINPGNSGGPLINLSGDLIGITTMKLTTEGYEGIAFAIPINEVIPVVEQIKQTGEVKRPILGIEGKDIAQLSVYQKSYLGIPLDRTKGVLVTNVLTGTPASEKGIVKNDILVRLGDVEITSFKAYRQALYALNSGDEVEVIVSRDNEDITFLVTIE